jgi:predicted short-subunit dehydrogenase-like oxidoreductase (DUF2520 family)
MTATPRVLIIGPGRLGNGLGRALTVAKWSVLIAGRSAKADWGLALTDHTLVLIAVPDDVIGDVARTLAETGEVTPAHTILHTSGALDRTALAPLHGKAGGLGSFAPVQTVADPATAADRLRGAYVIVEGDLRAVTAGKQLAEVLQMKPLELSPQAKVAYHVGAVTVANLGVALQAVAERVAEAGGVPAADAAKIYLPLWRGMVANLEAMGAVQSLTGPLRRGDADTIRKHLTVLRGVEREVYLALAQEALILARAGGLTEEKAEGVERALRDG